MTETPEPSLVGRYMICGQIAAGGMASVHLGRALGDAGFSRRVAIKRLHAQYATDPSFVAMLVDEARLAARIHHPNVVSTLDVVSRDGELFVVMDYVEGLSLSELLRETAKQGARLPPPVAIAIGLGMLDGLHAAHEAQDDAGAKLGLVHRDVSPQNVLVGVDGVARVIDFGVAKATGRLQTTREGQLKGKLAYMAKEQLERGAVDRRVDVYAASVVLWEMLAGRRLFRAEGEGQVVTLVLGGAPRPPSAHAPDVLAAIDEIVMRGLSLDADARYASAEHMALALRAAATPAPASEIATWIQKVGSDALEAHAEVVRDAASQTLQAPAVVSTNPATPSGRRRFTAIVPVLAVAIVSLGLVAFERGRSVATAASGPSSPALSQVPAAPTSAVAASPPIAIPPDPTLSASSTPPTPRPPPIIPVSPKRASRATPNANAACNPPYTVDEQGVHQFKRECVVGR